MEDDDTSTSPPTKAESAGVLRPAIVESATRERITGDRYRIGSRLGRGGMGEILEARDEQIGRDVAIKRMRSEAPSEDQMQRFLREARIQGQLEHPAIVPVHELGRDTDGRPYFAMKKLAGTTLADILARTRGKDQVSRQRLLRAFSDVCLAIEFAHTRGIIHRDLKPDNLMLGDFGETYVLDWGVAKVVGENDDRVGPITSEGFGTETGTAVGTPGYMAPEQVCGERDVDALADVYSLGCVLFEILTGQCLHPRGAAGLVTAVDGIDGSPVRRAPDREIPPELDALCIQATSRERGNRIASARELGERVQRFLDGDRDLAQRRTLAVQHLDVAEAAFASDDRRAAMREAGRALALDPTLHRAGELITRVMLEPPREVPAEVAEEFQRSNEEGMRRTAPLGALVTSAYLLFIPFLIASDRVPIGYSLAIAAFSCACSLYLWRLSRPGSKFVLWPITVFNVGAIAVIGMLFSPFLLGIPLGAVCVVGLTAGRFLSPRSAVVTYLAVCLAVVGPWLAERAGAVPVTMSQANGRLILEAPMLGSGAIYVILIVATGLVIGAALLLMRRARVWERTARQHHLLQAWQLRQLVTAPG